MYVCKNLLYDSHDEAKQSMFFELLVCFLLSTEIKAFFFFFSSLQKFKHKDIHLSANNRYYIEALMVDDYGPDHLSIAVLISGRNSNLLQPIARNMLSGIYIGK